MSATGSVVPAPGACGVARPAYQAWLTSSALGTGSVLGLDPWAPGGHQLENVAAKKLASFKVEAYRDRIIGAAVIAFVALIALEYARLFRWLWLFTATRATARARWLWFGGSTVILLATLALLDLLLIRWPTGSAG